MRAGLGAAAALAWREVIRFFRQRSRLVGASLQPIVFWLLVGSGFSGSFVPGRASGGPGYVEYLYPGILAMTLLFTAIFATISVVEDRKSGFLQALLVAPVPRGAVVLGQACGATLLALMQGTLMLALAPAAGLSLSLVEVLAAILVMAVAALGLTGLGLMLAWRLESTQGFHAIMNLAMLPMWMLSGALFPSEGAPGWLGILMRINPMTYGLSALRQVLYLEEAAAGSGASGLEALPAMAPSLLVLALFAVITLATAARMARKASA